MPYPVDPLYYIRSLYPGIQKRERYRSDTEMTMILVGDSIESALLRVLCCTQTMYIYPKLLPLLLLLGTSCVVAAREIFDIVRLRHYYYYHNIFITADDRVDIKLSTLFISLLFK